MQDFETLFIAKVPAFENVILWPYLDTHYPPIVTVGTGFNISLEEAVTIAFAISGVPATRESIITHYKTVQSMMGGMVADKYKYPGCLMISKAENARLLESKVCSMFTPELKYLFKDFDQFPTCVKVALLDMIYTLGLGGLKSYHEFIGAVHKGDWKTAASQCLRNSHMRAYDKRNAWTKLQFLAGVARRQV